MALIPNEENLRTLSFLLGKTLESDATNRKRAEQELSVYKGKPGFATLMLHLLKQQISLPIAQACSSYLKNYINAAWTEVVPDGEKEEIKRVFPSLMFSLPIQLHKQAGAILLIISKSDFPQNWQGLLPELVKKLETQDIKALQAVLKMINAILKPYRAMAESDAVNTQLIMILTQLHAPLLAFFKMVCQQIQATANDAKLMAGFLKCAKLIADIFRSLSSVNLPEPIEDALNDWFGAFKFLLTLPVTHAACLEHPDDEDRPGIFHQLQASILTVTYLYAERYEEEFGPFLQAYVQDAWTLLTKVGNKPRFDPLVAAAIKFLTSVAKSVAFELFKDPKTLSEICQHIVVPNVKLREDDAMLFEDDPHAYVNREVEGTSEESRRGAAVELVKGLRKNFEQQVTGIFAEYVTALLKEYHSDGKKWKSKDAAIYLITALAVQTRSRDGVTNTNQLVPIADFFHAEIVPELEAPVDRAAILQASALNFAANFRFTFGHQDFARVFPLFVKFLSSKSEATRSLAAHAIERFLSVTDLSTPQGGQPQAVPRFGRALLQPYLSGTLSALFQLLATQEGENPWTMKAIARVLALAETDAVPFVQAAIQGMGQRLERIYRQPANPIFGHYLWDALSACIRNTVRATANAPAAQAQALDEFERQLFPIFEKILTEPDADTFVPYVLQVMAYLIESRGAIGAPPGQAHPYPKRAGTLKPSYQPLLKRLTEPQLWESPGNVPALTRLLQAYVEHDPAYVASSNSVPRILGVFQRLVANKVNDFLGFFLLQSLTAALPLNLLDQYFAEIFRIVFARIQNVRTMQVIKSFLVFLATFCCQHGAPALVQRINAVQPGIFGMVLQSLWLPSLPTIAGKLERKRAAIASAKLLFECPEMLQPPFVEAWSAVLNTAVGLIENVEVATRTDTVEAVEDLEVTSSGFSTLRNAPKVEYDANEDVKDTGVYLAAMLKHFSSQHPGQLQKMVRINDGTYAKLLGYQRRGGIPDPLVH